MDSRIGDIQAAQWNAHAGVASLSFVLYDILLNLGDEIELIWTGPACWARLLYLVVRYVPLCVLCSLIMLIVHGITWTPERCLIMVVYQNVAIQSLTLAVELILLSRVYAMYNRNRILLLSLAAFLVAEVGSMIGILSITTPKFRMSEGCVVAHTPRLFSFYWILPLAFETTLLVLTFYKFFTSISGRSVFGGKHSIMFVLMRDGTWAYAIIFMSMLLNIVFYAVETNPLAGVGFTWEVATLSFAGSHVLLNTRRVALQPNNDQSYWTDVSALQFGTTGTARGIDFIELERPCELTTLKSA
ncbi:hypothetical protein L226DRAFT_237225 [Lentinus tigrinus ALCF2SS1-7]|uniref:DUF6533 domain-containing protein n=1 Tax=Lentinus tigrinus ALCF2SS1-6 TaxID=1328759 RepID=A0A5C2SP83_9APHY|nr:hypothetical protein L227DRAFT_570918 [Lentinus tigrinus ALCF2SS1-6]RPD78969.1 hypothetical protein L226DRAFT_237225 [Lentinus tigrinus ALCF2SS1-7]